VTGVVVLLGAAVAVTAALVSRPRPVTFLSPEELLKASQAVGFSPSTTAAMGLVELLPANASLPPASPDLLPLGSAAPDFELRTPTGDLVKLSSYRGKTVLLEFFATWCPHCQAEAPHMVRIFQSLPQAGFAVLAVNCDSEDPANVYAFDRYYEIPYPTLLDPGGRPGSFNSPGTAGRVTRAYRISLLPAFYIVDAKGRIAWRADGERPTVLIVKELSAASGP
jgi:peroxiredoxin